MKPIKTNQPVALAVILLTLFSCANNEIGQSKDVNPDTIYQQYILEYDESENKAAFFAQFRFAGENGTTLVLSNPAKFTFNNVEVKVDSTGVAGAFYRLPIPVNKVLGKHTLSLSGIDNRQYTNSFLIDSFDLVPPQESISRLVPALIHFKAPVLQEGDHIELTADGDSSFIVQYDAGNPAGYITIPVEQLQRQLKNELYINAALYRKLELQQQTKEGGELLTVQITKPIMIRLKEAVL